MPRVAHSFDDLIWEKSEDDWDKARLEFRRGKNVDGFATLIRTILQRNGKMHRTCGGGSFNATYRMLLDNEERREEVILRIPWPGIEFPSEKVPIEAATLCFISQNTSIPVPQLYYCGAANENPTGFGPFLIESYIKHDLSLSRALTTAECLEKDTMYILDPDVLTEDLIRAYKQLASYLLQLSKLEFPRIGSLMPIGDSQNQSIIHRPISTNMNNLVQLSNIPIALLPPEDTTYETSDEWYTALADMHMLQLVFQRNDIIDSPDDCRNKYVARVLFRRLAKQKKLSTFGFADDTWSSQALSSPAVLSTTKESLKSEEILQAPKRNGSFRLWCDDLRFGNVLVDKALRVKGVIDWEYTYAAPAQFVLDPPWWLIMQQPERHEKGIDEWIREYEPRLHTWLQCMEEVEVEEKEISRTFQQLEGITFKDGDIGSKKLETANLSSYMRQSWNKGRFWLNYAARNSWVFDYIYWRFLDERFFGDYKTNDDINNLWETRVDLLTHKERLAMELLVERKMEEKRLKNILDWAPEEAKQYLAQFLF